MFTTKSLCLIVCPIHEWLLFFKIFKSNLSSFIFWRTSSFFILSVLSVPGIVGKLLDTSVSRVAWLWDTTDSRQWSSHNNKMQAAYEITHTAVLCITWAFHNCFELRRSVNTGLSRWLFSVKSVSTKLNVRASEGGRGGAVCWALRHKTGGSGFNFQVADSFCPHSVALGFTQPRIEMSTEKFSWHWSGTSSSVLVVPMLK